MAEKQPSGTSTTSARPPPEPLRHRPLARASTTADTSSVPPLSASSPYAPHTGSMRRRSSFLTADSFDRASFRSSTDSLLLPRPHNASRSAAGHQGHSLQTEESSHLHSLPLALALLPAVGGLLFHNGGAVLTDLTLLILAAIFLNWSVRLPWDWYHSAQRIRVQEEAEQEAAENEGYFTRASGTIIEEEPMDMRDESGGDGDEDEAGSPVMSPSQPPAGPRSPPPAQPPQAASSAVRELRIHEVTALLACFLFPMAGAWLLHHIRAQLSRPSEGLVSNYNLSIFLLAAELRPLSHLLRMVQARTLHLQRVVATHPFASSNQTDQSLKDLVTRVDELEAHIAAEGTSGGTSPQEREKQLATSIEATLRKSLQPDLDAVTRATRRYEKRSTLLGAQTEARLSALEDRIADAVSLAAGAERARHERRAGPLAKMAGAAGLGVGAVGEGVSWAVSVPVRALEWGLETVRGFAQWALQSSLGRVVDLKRLGVIEDRKKPRRRSSADKPGWKGKEQAPETEGAGVDRFGSFGRKEKRARTVKGT